MKFQVCNRRTNRRTRPKLIKEEEINERLGYLTSVYRLRKAI